MALLAGNLLPASFRGVPFAVENSDLGGGRRPVVHEYPGREDVWSQDMGRSARRFRFKGFIVDNDVVFLGGPIQLQRALLLAALDAAGPGTLTHPTLGVLNVLAGPYNVGEDLGAATFSSVEIEFVESGSQTFPSLISNSSGLLSAATLCQVALAVDMVRAIGLATGMGQSRDDIASTATIWSTLVQQQAADATTAAKLATLLPGNFGRYAAGANAGFTGSTAAPYAVGTPISTVIADSAARRGAVADAATALANVIAGVTVTTTDKDVANAIVALIDALEAVCADPADALRLLLNLVNYVTVGSPTLSDMGIALSSAFRRAAATALVTAAGRYQPSSYDDASATLQAIAAALDGEIVRAGDDGSDQSFDALEGLQSAVVDDLTSRGASLSPVRNVTVPQSMPAPALAQRLYQDADRADGLVTEVNPISPLFMPTSFQALAS